MTKEQLDVIIGWNKMKLGNPQLDIIASLIDPEAFGPNTHGPECIDCEEKRTASRIKAEAIIKTFQVVSEKVVAMTIFKDRLFVATDQGIYEYNQDKGMFNRLVFETKQ